MTSVAEPHMIAKRGRSLGERAITALLTNPVAMALKRLLRDLAWVAKGSGLLSGIGVNRKRPSS